MRGLAAALWSEVLKARRSRVPWLSALGFSLAPLVGGLFMIVLEDPDQARRLGLLGAKAQITAGVADWPTYLELLARATAVGGLIVFGLVAIWVFGREYSHRTASDLLALPTSRAAIVGAKFIVIAAWSGGLVAMVYILGLGIGFAVGLPGWSAALGLGAAGDLVLTGILTIAVVIPLALVASMGRGYLAPIGFMFLTLFLSQILAAAGWGAYFPWSVPALFARVAGAELSPLAPVSHALVAVVAFAGVASTLAWWRFADQTGR